MNCDYEFLRINVIFLEISISLRLCRDVLRMLKADSNLEAAVVEVSDIIYIVHTYIHT